MAEIRVAERVSSGGHDIPKDVIHRRYWRGLKNLFSLYAPIADLWSLYNNEEQNSIIADTNIVYNKELFKEIKDKCKKNF